MGTYFVGLACFFCFCFVFLTLLIFGLSFFVFLSVFMIDNVTDSKRQHVTFLYKNGQQLL